MILRRFTQHVKEQNWFAVGLDVCVVIVGIVIGLQVTEWKEQRAEHAKSLANIELIVSEIKLHITHYEKRKERVPGQLETLSIFKKGINTPNSIVEFPGEFMMTTLTSRYRVYTPLSRSVYDGLEKSGEVLKLPAQKTISRVRNYYHAITGADLVLNGSYDPWKEYNNAMAGYLDFEQISTISYAFSTGSTLEDVDADSAIILAKMISEDPEVRKWLPEVESITAAVLTFDARLEKQARDIVKELETFLENNR